MNCPKCGKDARRVIETRTVPEDNVIRRRCECTICKHRFTTYEMEQPMYEVILRERRWFADVRAAIAKVGKG